MSADEVVIEMFGEGAGDLGEPLTRNPTASPPTAGVVPILVHALCERPSTMRIKRKKYVFLQGKSLKQKVAFAKRQAYYNPGTNALIVVLDTDGEHPRKLKELESGRDSSHVDLPTAVGVAHPCVEAWLMADAEAIAHALSLPRSPAVPDEPEALPAPCRDRHKNAKTELAKHGGGGPFLDVKSMWAIARAMVDLGLVKQRCPMSFLPFADEIEARIKPLFGSP